VRVSKTLFEPDLPYWQDHLPFLQQLTGRDFPTCDQLNALLADGLKSESGQNIKFVPSTELDDGAYEHRIYTTGQVSTRPDNWHDLFNALVWMRFPRIKIAMNTLHFHAYSEQTAGSRGPLRDALTLFDECGVIVFSNHLDKLNSLAERRWAEVFQRDEPGHLRPRHAGKISVTVQIHDSQGITCTPEQGYPGNKQGGTAGPSRQGNC